MDIAPGSILQRMHLKRRLKRFNKGTFCEIGSGKGHISNIFLKKGLIGVGYDLNEQACKKNEELNAEYIRNKKYKVINGDFLKDPDLQKFDIILSSMVIEHLSPDQVKNYFRICREKLAPGGRIIVFVPSSMKYWGIEDEIAGHYKRYQFDDFRLIAKEHDLKIENLSGLTYPVSNLLFSLSNKLINKSEGYKKNLDMQQQTVLSGNRDVMYKTTFPGYLRIILNEYVLWPFYLLQKANKNNPDSMVIYAEFSVQ